MLSIFVPSTTEQMNLKAAKFLNYSFTIRELIFLVLLLICTSSLISPPVALLLGILVAQIIGNPFIKLNHKATQILLQLSVVGLGFGLDAKTAVKAGSEGFVFALVSIVLALLMGLLIGKLLKIGPKTSFLIAVGTAICGGSAIAAVSPVVKAKEQEISVALGVVFILNAVALFVFPAIGSWLGMSQQQFGIWSAVAIHDTSSVVGAAGKYGNEALAIATTVKLTRALWIIPVTLISAWVFRSKSKISPPWFIAYFIMAVMLNTFIPSIATFSSAITRYAHTGMVLTLFLIGSGLSRELLATLGLKPVLQGIALWIFVSTIGLWMVMNFV